MASINNLLNGITLPKANAKAAELRAHIAELHKILTEAGCTSPSEVEQDTHEFTRFDAVVTLHATCAKAADGSYYTGEKGYATIARISMKVHTPFFEEAVVISDGRLMTNGKTSFVALASRSYTAKKAWGKVAIGDNVNVDVVAASKDDRNRIKAALHQAMKNDGFELKRDTYGDPTQAEANDFFGAMVGGAKASTNNTSGAVTAADTATAFGG